MAILSRTQLKALWIDGFIPDQNDYVDFFDSFRSMLDVQPAGYAHPNQIIIQSGVTLQENYFSILQDNFNSPARLQLSHTFNQGDKILDVTASYDAPVQSAILMTVQSIDDPVNAGRKALRIMGIEDENTGDEFSLSGNMEIFQGVNTILDTQAFSFDGSVPEILIDNIDPALGSTAMRFVNTQESDLLCVNITAGGTIKTFGNSTVFSNTFTYSEYITPGNTVVDREGVYETNKRNNYLVPRSKVVWDNLRNIVIDTDSLPGFFLLAAAEKTFDVKVEYLELTES